MAASGGRPSRQVNLLKRAITESVLSQFLVEKSE